MSSAAERACAAWRTWHTRGMDDPAEPDLWQTFAEAMDAFALELDPDGKLELGACFGCGRPTGTGTLLDYSPEPPAGAPEGTSADAWARFALRYRCPVCSATCPGELELDLG